MTNQWIYILSKKLDGNSASSFLSSLKHFLLSWDSHGSIISAEAYLLLKQVIIVTISDTSVASGCSISALRNQVSNLAREQSCQIVSSNLITLIENNEISFFERKNIKEFLKTCKNLSTIRVVDQNLTFSSIKGIESISTLLQDSWLIH